MVEALDTLTDKEKETLRLVLRGHDAKSMARELDLSVHTINERLRHARRKLEVTSSREAARMLLDAEGETPQSLGHKELGEDPAGAGLPNEDPARAGMSPARKIGGLVVMTLALATLALVALTQGSSPAADAAAIEAREAQVRAEVAASALAWLALVDEGRWEESWAATGTTFRELNTSEIWASVSEDVRVPLGAVTSRELADQDFVPAPPNGYVMVKLHTSFANKADTMETLALVREAGEWKVVGYVIG